MARIIEKQEQTKKSSTHTTITIGENQEITDIEGKEWMLEKGDQIKVEEMHIPDHLEIYSRMFASWFTGGFDMSIAADSATPGRKEERPYFFDNEEGMDVGFYSVADYVTKMVDLTDPNNEELIAIYNSQTRTVEVYAQGRIRNFKYLIDYYGGELAGLKIVNK